MTWVIGKAYPFGYAAAAADIRVTLGDGTELDCLQKLHPVGPFIGMGFAGSVAIGFRMLQTAAVELRRGVGPGQSWEPDTVAGWWPGAARATWALCPSEEQELGCDLLMIGAHPRLNNGDAPWARSYVFRFRSPEFAPIPTAGLEVVSIGSGEGVAEYQKALESLGGFSLLQLEVGQQGGAALGLAHSLTSTLSESPTPGISKHLHVCLALRDKIMMATNDRRYPDAPDLNIQMPPVAGTYGDLVRMLSERHLSHSRARC